MQQHIKPVHLWCGHEQQGPYESQSDQQLEHKAGRQ